ncbi:hypothetical protein ACROYT_G043895 [Oculina patagonica]
MGSPLGPLMANVFMCHLEEKLTCDDKMPSFYRRYVDDTLARMPSTEAATEFLTTLNGLHPNLSFTMELPVNNKIPFIGMDIIMNGTRLETAVYRKPTNTGLLLHFHSHTDKRYKDCLIKTMVHRAHALSSTIEAFNEECDRLRSIFSRLDYPMHVINSTINNFVRNVSADASQESETHRVIRVSLPFKDQTSANAVRRHLSKASGPDNMPAWLLKENADLLALVVTDILNCSYKEAKLPHSWKHADITPIPKQIPVQDANKHLRPISLTPILSKLAEEFIVDRYIKPAVLAKVDPRQFGTVPSSSTTEALISMIHEWNSATDGDGATVRADCSTSRKPLILLIITY